MKVVVFAIILISFGLFSSFIFCNKADDRPPHVIVAEKFMERMKIKLIKKHHFNFLGTYNGMFKTINLMGFIFELDRNVTKDEGRRIFIDCMNEFLDAINQDDSIRPYLAVYPFDFDHIDMTIYFNKEDQAELHHPNLGLITKMKNSIHYYTYDSESKRSDYKVDEKESFEEALKIVNGQMEPPVSSIK